ncbi:unnamed protein product [Caenorhabditis sp. 36 PRJEB53466]|nr:unnamed protein product [Caenorhabditis sp. 36 PRJEB53466]
MRRRRRFLALLFIFSAFITPLGFFYLTIASENRHDFPELSARIGFRTDEVRESHEQKAAFDFRKFSEDECLAFPKNCEIDYPDCANKMNWIRSGWKTHKCYADNRVDGSECSFRFYLSHVERYCPPMDAKRIGRSVAKMSPSIRRLLPILDSVPHYMKTRITRLWNKWKEGAREVVEKFRETMTDRRKLNVLVFIGFLANEQKLNLAKKSDHGGPLGELLQWSDLLASLSIIGHRLEVSSDKDDLRRIVWKYQSRGPCQFVNGTRQHLDIIFTDIMGLNILRQHHRQFLAANRCRMRLLDSFGTHAEFTSKAYFLQNKKRLSGPISARNPWGGHGLDLRQHWTFYPHSDDNTFLGFVVDTEGIANVTKEQKGQPSALVYGKEQYMWAEAEKPMQVLKRHVAVHATVADINRNEGNTSRALADVINHGFLNSRQIAELLDRTTIFFGLGFPLEGPAPMEAIAHGAVFINARFREPKSRKNYKFLAEKPTLREWTSQNPYMEMIGEPHVITVDIENEQELEEAIRKAINLKPPPLVPFEFSPAGMLLRVAVLLEKQELCDRQAMRKRWPPVDQMTLLKTSNSKESCEMTCRKKNLLCEPSYFPIINNSSILTREFSCSSITSSSSPLAPFNCTVQLSPSLFSCASRTTSTQIVRLCPCRDHLPQQHAICKKCL